jgi:hypothetical protein
LIERYDVRQSESIIKFELNSYKASHLTHHPGQHKLCYIDGDVNSSLLYAKSEVAASTTMWSSDPWDYMILEGSSAQAHKLKTIVSKRRAVGMTDLVKMNITQKAFGGAGQSKANAMHGTHQSLETDGYYVDGDRNDSEDGENVDEGMNPKGKSKGSIDASELTGNEIHSALNDCRVLHVCATVNSDNSSNGRGEMITNML